MVPDAFPSPSLEEGVSGLSQVIEVRVQDVDLDEFTSHQAGDILFIDSRHVLKVGVMFNSFRQTVVLL